MGNGERTGDESATPFLDLHRDSVRPKPERVIIKNLVIQQLAPEQLHANWAWIKRGAEDIIKRIRPRDSSSWIPEDLYAALRYPEASHMVFWMVTRNQRALG